MEEESVEVLDGGIANAGSVVRVGEHVLRPANEHSAAIHTFLRALRSAGFEGVSEPVGIEDGRERLVFIAGDVAVPPYPDWAQSDPALASIARLMRRFHEAASGFDPTALTWSAEMADSAAGAASRDAVVCHNDVCLENVVFRDGVAVGLLDFDFAAPGRPIYDLVQFARMCVPIDDPDNAAKLGWLPADGAARLRLLVDSYGLGPPTERRLFLDLLDESIARGGEFIRRRIDAGDANFIKALDEVGGMERFDRRRRWWSGHQRRFADAVV